MKVLYVLFKDDISSKKIASQSHTFPSSQGKSYVANNAIDRNPAVCMRSMDIGRTSQEKTVWWKLDLGGVSNIYSVSIWFGNVENGMFC